MPVSNITRGPRARRPCDSRRAFTLIELLIVVAIIAILAAIAVPNFLEAQTRSKTARVKNDLRTLATVLESYRVDQNAYPPSSTSAAWIMPVSRRLNALTTPVAYASSYPRDPFPVKTVAGGVDVAFFDSYDYAEARNYTATGSGRTSGGVWRVCSPGPDLELAFGGMIAGPDFANVDGVDYDPTNGSVSTGDIVRVGAQAPTSTGDPADLNNPNRPAILRVPMYREQ
jgi:type II secretion system protein G